MRSAFESNEIRTFRFIIEEPILFLPFFISAHNRHCSMDTSTMLNRQKPTEFSIKVISFDKIRVSFWQIENCKVRSLTLGRKNQRRSMTFRKRNQFSMLCDLRKLEETVFTSGRNCIINEIMIHVRLNAERILLSLRFHFRFKARQLSV